MGKFSRLLKVGLKDPLELVDRIAIVLQGRTELSEDFVRDDRTMRSEQVPQDLEGIAERLGRHPWPSSLVAEWSELWSGLDYRAGHDADPALVRMLWTACRTRRPDLVVETGVGRGLSTAVILDALDKNGKGRLISIDLPPLAEPWFSASAELVPDRLRSRWECRRGSVRRRLPRLVRQLALAGERIDIHLADSLHTAAHIDWEVGAIAPMLAPDGIVFVDDAATWAVHPSSWERAYFRHEDKAGLFALVGPGSSRPLKPRPLPSPA